MSNLTTEILVIGGGSTGVGIVRDAALRGFKAVLVERSDLATGTTGRFHGLLHSGGRYAVKDPISAKECIDENRVLRKIAADCIEDTGGLFVITDHDDPAFAEPFLAGCQKAGIPVQDMPLAEVLRREPRLNPKISRAFWVPDATIDSWKTCWANARDAQAHGAQILVYHKVMGLIREADTVTGAVVKNMRTGEELTIHADFTVNASGAWAGQIAAMAGVNVTVVGGKGIMIAMNHRLTHMVINRCKRPSDGDIIVPIHTVCIIGTTDVRVADPDDWPIEDKEVQYMLDEGEKLVPGFRQARALRVWGGVRPLYQPNAANVTDTRDVSRTYTLLDHPETDGVKGFVTMTGGKFTTYRQMAEVTMDMVCRHLKTERPCTTATQAMPGSEEGRFYWLGSRLAKREADMQGDQLICECELIPRKRLLNAFEQFATIDLDDIRRVLRLSMGPCQGGFCMYRAAGLLHEVRKASTDATNQALLRFLQERWKGDQPLLWGDQLRQAQLDNWIFQSILDVQHLPPVNEPAAVQEGRA
ncbi:MAG TPA: anaerobic glycerol-3-phosphate dehydrogenase subunit GlpA [Aggregatilineales bacterium]|nr:anaerobic glycerol-3-phosphate dehydrogenase subunit GlpA [Aggregatilineales bacterium]